MATQEREEFIQLCTKLKVEILECMEKEHGMPKEAIEWINQVIEYNCIGGKLNRGISVIHWYGQRRVNDLFSELIVYMNSTQALVPGNSISPELKEKASILGWCIEWLQAFFLVADDIMDESLMRRGQACWYRNPKVKMIAINDAFLLESFVFQILKKHFRSESCYLDLVELFHEVIYKTEMGQLLDLTSQPLDEQPDLNRFTLERYRKIVINKTAYYTFYLSVACAMLLSGVVDDASHNLAKKICIEIGEYFQIQDDYLDCYGDEKIIGKIGTDIQDNKCTWLVVQALIHANSEQKVILKVRLNHEHYGRSNLKSVETIKKLYHELNLTTIYKEYEDQMYIKLCTMIDQVTVTMPSQVFTMLLSKIFKRNK